jgi:hypothetical protein
MEAKSEHFHLTSMLEKEGNATRIGLTRQGHIPPETYAQQKCFWG